MNRFASATLPLFFAAAAFAAPVDEFLKEIDSIVVGNSPEAAVTAIDKRLAEGGLAPDDEARIKLRKAKLIAKERTKAGSLVLNGVLRIDGVKPETKLQALHDALEILHKTITATPGVKLLREMRETVLALPEFQAKGVNRGRMLEFVATTYSRRNMCDLACAAYREAADNFADAPERRAKALFRVSELSLRYRDLATAEAALDEIAAMADLPPATIKLAKLRKGLAVIGVSGYDWHPAPERVERARAIIEDALAPLGHQQLIPNDEAFKAKARLVYALHRCGQSVEAAKLGEETLANAVLCKAAGPVARDNLRVLVGDIIAQVGNYKVAIKYYEQGMSYAWAGRKPLHKRIATLARKHKDYQRAMQAYADASALCDRVEGKDEIKFLNGLVGQMSKAIRNKTNLADSDDVFGKTDDNINNLNLDEL